VSRPVPGGGTGRPTAVPDAAGTVREPGAGVRRLVRVMDTLRSPGGCPWDAEQTHESLVPYVLEEAHEVAEAIEAGDRAGMREELGDVLLQVVFHARLAQEHPTDPFDLDDVADGLTAKLVRRHPHVFDRPQDADAPADAADPAVDVHVRWEEIKRAEKSRTSVLDGIPLGQGALARTQKVLVRARRSGLAVDVEGVAARHTADVGHPADAVPDDAAAADLGVRLLRLAAEAADRGVDAEAALRAALRTVEATVRDLEGR
jgi:XTP/dITP diphosphohydrolase